MPNNGPSFTKATYDKRRSQRPAPLPMRHKEAEAADAAKSRRFNKRVTEVGLGAALGLFEPKLPEPPLRRRI